MELISGIPIPHDSHEERLDNGLNMMRDAYFGKLRALEQELQGLRISSEELKGQATTLQKKNGSLEVELQDSQEHANKLAAENKDLFKTVQQLRKKLARLDILKSKVVESLTQGHEDDDTDEGGGASSIGGGYSRRPPSSAAASRGISPSPTPPAALGGLPPQQLAPRLSGGQLSTPVMESPIASEANSNVDGKQFFRKARSVLSNDSFNDFLASIKRLNSQQQTRDETLADAARIFGPQHQELAREFEHLLHRHTF